MFLIYLCCIIIKPTVMYSFLLIFHSVFRWLVLGSLVYSIARAWYGQRKDLAFTKTDNALRHWTATIAHIQLMTGIVLYTQSPAIKYYFSNTADTSGEPLFFAILHILLMLSAIVVITISSAKAKRKVADKDKFNTMLTWFSAGIFLILIAIPWPFSPIAHRPLIRF